MAAMRPDGGPTGRMVDQAPLWAGALGSQLTAAWLVVRSDSHEAEFDVPAFAAFSTQLMLSVAWLLLFFRLHRPALALADLCLLWVATAVTAREFARKHRVAAALVVPYLAWVGFAVAVHGRTWWRSR